MPTPALGRIEVADLRVVGADEATPDHFGAPVALAAPCTQEVRWAPPRRGWCVSLVNRLLRPTIDTLVVLSVLGLATRHGRSAIVFGVFVVAMLEFEPRESLRLQLGVGDDVPNLVTAVAIPLLAITPLLTLGRGDFDIAKSAPVLLVILSLGRWCTHMVVEYLRCHGRIVEAAIIIGAGEVGQRLACAFDSEVRFGIRPIGFLEDDPFGSLRLPVLGSTGDLLAILRSTGVRRVIVAYGSARDASMVSVLRACDEARVTLYILPRFFELGVLPSPVDIDEINGMQLVRLRRAPLRSSSRLMKRSAVGPISSNE